MIDHLWFNKTKWIKQLDLDTFKNLVCTTRSYEEHHVDSKTGNDYNIRITTKVNPDGTVLVDVSAPKFGKTVTCSNIVTGGVLHSLHTMIEAVLSPRKEKAWC